MSPQLSQPSFHSTHWARPGEVNDPVLMTRRPSRNQLPSQWKCPINRTSAFGK